MVRMPWASSRCLAGFLVLQVGLEEATCVPRLPARYVVIRFVGRFNPPEEMLKMAVVDER